MAIMNLVLDILRVSLISIFFNNFRATLFIFGLIKTSADNYIISTLIKSYMDRTQLK